MLRNHYTPEQIVTKLKQIEVLMSQGKQILLLEIFLHQNRKGFFTNSVKVGLGSTSNTGRWGN